MGCPVSLSQDPEDEKTDVTDIEELKEKADQYFYEEDYAQALSVCKELYKRLPNDPLVNFYLGVSYLNLSPSKRSPGSKAKSIPYLEFALKKLPIIDVTYYLARAYHLTYQFNKAIPLYQSYHNSLEKSEPVFLAPLLKSQDEMARIERQIEMCNNGIILIKDTVKNIHFENIGEAINSEYTDYAPAVSADNEVLVFTSRRQSQKSKKLAPDAQPYEDIYLSYKKDGKWMPAVPISENINSKRHDASVGLSADGQSLFIYYKGDIYMSVLDGIVWSKPKRLNPPVNSSFWETHISITSSRNTVYFASDRPGGYGGRDLYSAKRLSSGEWGMVKNLGPTINTSFDEDAPFIHPDERHLYFCSNGHNSMGGFDIFYSDLVLGDWSHPLNLGYPLNTPDDDVFFTVSANGKTGYLATTREEGYGEKDIYAAKMIDTGEVALTVVRGIIRGDGSQPIAAKFLVSDKKTSEVIGIYNANSATGKYLLVFPPGKEYNLVISAEGYVPHSSEIVIPEQDRFYDLFQEVQLASVVTKDSTSGKDSTVGQRVFMRNAFFDVDSAISLMDSSLKSAEIKEIAYSALMSGLENGPKKEEMLASLDTASALGKMIGNYHPEEEIHLVSALDTADLQMQVIGYDTLYTTSAKTIIAPDQMDTSVMKIEKVHYTSKEEVDTAIFRPEVYLAFKPPEELLEALPPPDTIKEQQAYLTMDELNHQLNDLEKKVKAEEQQMKRDSIAKVIDAEIAMREKEKEKKSPKKDTIQSLSQKPEEVRKETQPVPVEGLLGKSFIINNILFDFNSAVLKTSSYTELDKIINLLKEHKDVFLEISGHTDSIGFDEYNLRLSELRAKSVVVYIRNKGIRFNRLNAKGFGETMPIESNTTEQGRERNRRVEMKVIGISKPLTPTPPVPATTAALTPQPPDISGHGTVPNGGEPAHGAATTSFSVGSAAICTSVENRVPVGEGTSFPASAGRLYFFTAVNGPDGNESHVLHRWYYGEKKVLEIKLPVKGPAWRTFSSKTILPQWKGSWKAEAVGPDGSVLGSKSFTIE